MNAVCAQQVPNNDLSRGAEVLNSAVLHDGDGTHLSMTLRHCWLTSGILSLVLVSSSLMILTSRSSGSWAPWGLVLRLGLEGSMG